MSSIEIFWTILGYIWITCGLANTLAHKFSKSKCVPDFSNTGKYLHLPKSLFIFDAVTHATWVWKVFCEFGKFGEFVEFNKGRLDLIHKDESMCGCVWVSPPDPHKPSPQNLAWAPHVTRVRSNLQI